MFRGRDGKESVERGVVEVLLCRRLDGRESVERGVVGVLCVQGPRWKGVDGEGGDWIVVCSGAEMEGSRWRGGGVVEVLCVQETRWKGVDV